MKYLFMLLATFTSLNLQAAANCPKLEGDYTCLFIFDGEEETEEITIQQKTVGDVEHFEVPLLDGNKWVIADGVSRGSEMDYKVATCVGGLLKVTEFKKQANASYQGDFQYTLKSQGKMELVTTYTLEVDGQKEQSTDKAKCKLK